MIDDSKLRIDGNVSTPTYQSAIVNLQSTIRLEGLVALTNDKESASPSLEIVSTIYPASPAIEEMIDRFWEAGSELDSVRVDVGPPGTPLALLEALGPSPFERGGFPVIGFLASTYDRVSRYALERGGA